MTPKKPPDMSDAELLAAAEAAAAEARDVRAALSAALAEARARGLAVPEDGLDDEEDDSRER